MPKQSSKETKGRSSRKLDTTIIVALIALVGTLATALFSSPVIIAWIQRTPVPPSQTNQPSSAFPNTGETSNPLPIASIPAASGDQEDCLIQFFADIDPAKQVSIEVGAYDQDFYISSDELASKDFVGPFGIKLTQNGKMIAALSFLFFPDSQLSKITSIVDSNCQPISDYSNASRGGDPNSIQNNNLQIQLAEGSFVLGFQFSGTDFIRFDFRQLL